MLSARFSPGTFFGVCLVLYGLQKNTHNTQMILMLQLITTSFAFRFPFSIYT